jgi:hypothetical protein
MWKSVQRPDIAKWYRWDRLTNRLLLFADLVPYLCMAELCWKLRSSTWVYTRYIADVVEHSSIAVHLSLIRFLGCKRRLVFTHIHTHVYTHKHVRTHAHVCIDREHGHCVRDRLAEHICQLRVCPAVGATIRSIFNLTCFFPAQVVHDCKAQKVSGSSSD